MGDAVAGPSAAHLVVVEGPADSQIPSPQALPLVVAYVGQGLGDRGPANADLVVGPDDVDRLEATVLDNPLSSTSLAILLRTRPSGTEAGLAAESAVYSMLQAGPEFGRWRQTHMATPAAGEPESVVDSHRDGSTLRVALNRPARHNAFSAAMRDQLFEMLALATVDETLERIELRGNGPSFCSGGDLDEFGSRPDPATAHTVRLARSPARLLDRLADQLTVYVHGYALGGGIEMAAFAGTVVADPGTRIGLPEPDLGLIPGAGGTVSITRRCGRQRTAALALATDTIDAETAHRWGLVDTIDPGGTK